ncbi:FAD-binding oxidoreductase [Nonomuraea sp. SMC257]|uniref:FAD-binding oxidoreductase n=1 Tax=Nonomuraea montanisoli TaxID=2741721 RepID=A0A7Y6IHY0_9ACTN|nr:FAD-binding oxidoreductase [Nonomuraea montanisoli]NUW38346.1 FAD-binding oxidoreductase [Nonomuraea montanisoli]
MTSENLRNVVKGRVLLPGDSGFDQASSPWTVGVPQPVSAVVEAEDAADVAALVRHARDAGLTIAAQPSGHGASGDVEGVILLRTGRLDGVEVDPSARVVRVGAGARWGRVLAATGAHGLAGPAGSSPVVSVAGFVAGGGLSWFSRKHGWGADSVRAFEVVDAGGEQVRVTAESDADLFWALRGGGGDFAMITAVELELFPLPVLYGGRLVWPGDRTGEVFEAFRQVTAGAPDELSVWVNRVQPPSPAPAIVTVDVTYLGGADEARDLLAPFEKIGGVLSDNRAIMDVANLGGIADEPVDPSPSLSRAELLTGLDDAVLEALTAEPLAPLLNLHLRHLGGALAEAGPAGGAGGALAEPYLLYLLGLRLPGLAEAVPARQEELVRRLGGRVSGRKPYTFLVPGEGAAQAFGAEALTRLREIKKSRDPGQVFRANFPVLG